MNFLCNSCFALKDNDETAGKPFFITTCFHILCSVCSQKIRNNECIICKKQCRIAVIGRDLTLGRFSISKLLANFINSVPQKTGMRALFEPPMPQFQKIQQQLRFLRQQQEFTFKLKKIYDESQKKKAQRIQQLLGAEQKYKAEVQRVDKIVKEKIIFYRDIKVKYKAL